MLSLPVQKDIGEYSEKIVMGLSAATLACSGVGIVFAAATVGLCKFVLQIPDDVTYLAAAMFVMVGFAVGFVKPLGMSTWDAAPYLIRSYLKSDSIVRYRTSVALAEAARRTDAEKEVRKHKKERSKEDVRIQKEYLDAREERGVRSPEWILPRYAGWQPGE